MMTYAQALQVARGVKSYAEVDVLLKSIEESFDTISDAQFYSIKNVALNAAFNAISGERKVATMNDCKLCMKRATCKRETGIIFGGCSVDFKPDTQVERMRICNLCEAEIEQAVMCKKPWSEIAENIDAIRNKYLKMLPPKILGA